MRFLRPGGRVFRRHSFAVPLSACLIFCASATLLAADGIVVDPSGRPLPRARVRVIDRQPEPGAADVFTDESGRFTLDASGTCEVEASLAGFRTARVPCSTAPLRMQLALAPVEETVVVTATRTDVPSSQVGAATTTFTADDIARRQSPLVVDLLRTSPGAAIVQTSAPGGVTSLFVRGGESNYNTVLIDGIPMNEPGGAFNFGNLTTENVERIEVVRGAHSALFGSDAMSSVVQLFTKRAATGSPRFAAQVDGGSYGTVHASASAAGATGRWDYSAAVAQLSTDNRVPNNAFDNTTVSATLGASVNERTTIRAIVRGEIGETGSPGQTAYGRPDMDAYFEQHQIAAGITFDQQVTRAFRQRATYSNARTNQASVNLIADPPYTPAYGGSSSPFEWYDFTFDTRNRLRRHYASYQGDWRASSGTRAGTHLISALADWTGERAELEDRAAGETTSPSRDNFGIAAQHQMLIGRLTTSVGGRVENNESFGVAAVPRASVVYAVREQAGTVGDTRIRAAAGFGIKEPTLLQSFSLSPFFLGSPDLEPERSRSVELGVEQRLGSDRVKLDLTWFDNRYRNIIGLQSTGGSNSQYMNVGLTDAQGIELGAEAAPVPALRLRGGYTLVDSVIVESTSSFSPVFAVGNWAFRRPRHSGFVQGSWNWQRVTADLTGTFIGRFVDSDFSSLEPPITENPGWTTWDARLSWRFAPPIVALLAIDNLANRQYQQPLGYPALGRAARVGVRAEF